MKELIAEELIRLAETSPEEWDIGQYKASIRGISIWIENRPYADMAINGIRVGGFFSRRRLRKAIDNIKLKGILRKLYSPSKK